MDWERLNMKVTILRKVTYRLNAILIEAPVVFVIEMGEGKSS